MILTIPIVDNKAHSTIQEETNLHDKRLCNRDIKKSLLDNSPTNELAVSQVTDGSTRKQQICKSQCEQ